MSALDAELTSDLRAGEYGATMAQAAQLEMLAACKAGNWPAAEDARNRALAHLESSLDAFMRAHKRLAVISGRL